MEIKIIRELLIGMAAEDQRLRFTRPIIIEEIRAADRRHTDQLKEIVRQIGWPTISKVGSEAAHAAWLLTQHADDDPEFQKEALRLMRTSFNDVSLVDIAYLEDRVRKTYKQDQLYGTQFYIDGRGRRRLWPIEEPETLEERRQTMGLGPLNCKQAVKTLNLQQRKKG